MHFVVVHYLFRLNLTIQLNFDLHGGSTIARVFCMGVPKTGNPNFLWHWHCQVAKQGIHLSSHDTKKHGHLAMSLLGWIPQLVPSKPGCSQSPGRTPVACHTLPYWKRYPTLVVSCDILQWQIAMGSRTHLLNTFIEICKHEDWD